MPREGCVFCRGVSRVLQLYVLGMVCIIVKDSDQLAKLQNVVMHNCIYSLRTKKAQISKELDASMIPLHVAQTIYLFIQV